MAQPPIANGELSLRKQSPYTRIFELTWSTRSVHPSEIALRNTYDFVRANLRAHSRVLDVGCGKGELAARLQHDRHQVLAIDESEEAVREARDRGVGAQCCDFVDFQASESFDAVLFARSLHHIHPLETAVGRAFELLRPGGVLLADEFDHEAMDHDTARWLYGMSEILWLAGVAEQSEFPGLREREPLEHWLEEHAQEPPLHTGQQMAAAIASLFSGLRRTDGCYLFRYFCRDLRNSPTGYKIAAKILDLETSLIGQNRIKAIGIKLVAAR
jgi:SAM-dependent methyltransferase